MRLALLILLITPMIALSQSTDKVSIYPNPATDEITVNLGQLEDVAMVKILTQNGKVVWSEHRKESEFKLNLELYPKGVYHLQVSVLDKVEVYRFVKR